MPNEYPRSRIPCFCFRPGVNSRGFAFCRTTERQLVVDVAARPRPTSARKLAIFPVRGTGAAAETVGVETAFAAAHGNCEAHERRVKPRWSDRVGNFRRGGNLSTRLIRSNRRKPYRGMQKGRITVRSWLRISGADTSAQGRAFSICQPTAGSRLTSQILPRALSRQLRVVLVTACPIAKSPSLCSRHAERSALGQHEPAGRPCAMPRRQNSRGCARPWGRVRSCAAGAPVPAMADGAQPGAWNLI